MDPDRLNVLQRRLDSARESVGRLERVESELRSLSLDAEPRRVEELLFQNASALNAARMRVAAAQASLDGRL